MTTTAQEELELIQSHLVSVLKYLVVCSKKLATKVCKKFQFLLLNLL